MLLGLLWGDMRTEGGLCCISASPLSSCHARGGHPAVPISPYMSHVPTSLRPHILISPYPHVPFPMSATPPVALLCLLLKEQRRKAAPLSPNPQSRGSAVWARRPPCPLCHPRVSPCHRVPPPHETPMLPSLKMDLRPRLGAQRGAVGLGRGVWGGLCVCMCVCECTRACTALPPAAGRGQQSCRQRSWVGCEGVHARAGTVCTRRAVRAQRRASPPPLHSYTRTTLTHTHHPCTPLCGPAAQRGGVAGGAERRGTQPRGVQTAGCEPAGRKPLCR